MRIGASTACLYPMMTENSLQTMLELGVKELEIFFNSPSELNKKFVKMLHKMAKNYGASVRSVHPYSSMMEPFMFFTNYERRFNDMMDMYKAYFDAAVPQLWLTFPVFHTKLIDTVLNSGKSGCEYRRHTRRDEFRKPVQRWLHQTLYERK